MLSIKYIVRTKKRFRGLHKKLLNQVKDGMTVFGVLKYDNVEERAYNVSGLFLKDALYKILLKERIIKSYR